MDKRKRKREEKMDSLAHILKCKQCGRFRYIGRSGLVCFWCRTKIELVPRATMRLLRHYFWQCRID